MLIDSHAHLDDKKYGSVEKLLENFSAAGGGLLIDIGFDYDSSLSAKERADKYPNVYFAAGYHPQEADKNNDNALIAALTASDRCVAIGEIGLDYHYEPFDKNRQKELFVSQIALADECGLPIVIHSRDASAEMLSILKENSSNLKHGFLMHCYSESKEQARNYLDLGAYFAFGGAITFKNAKKDDTIRYIPFDRLLAETDCPYMAPVPYRGNLNEPQYVSFVYDKFADILGVGRAVVEEQFEKNFFTFFKKARR